MPKVTDYSIISESRVTLTSSAPGDFQEVHFDLDSPDVGSRSILAWNMDEVEASGFKFRIKVNSSKEFTYNIGSGASGDDFFTIHTVVGKNILKPKNNVIQFKALTQNTGAVRFADIVIWYQHVV